MNPSSKNGYLSVPKDATIHTIREPSSNKTGKVKRLFTSWSSSSAPMFTKETLSVADIHQGAIGDCWFLAAAAAIIGKPHGSNAIKRTVIDCGDGWCIVRLYDGDLKPVYIRTRKSRASFLGTKYGVTGTSQTGFWSTALEKAACCFTGTNRTVIDVDNPSIKNTEGGDSSDAFRMLLGCQVTHEVLKDNLDYGGGTAPERTYSELVANWTVSTPPNATQILQEVFGGSVSVNEWKTYRPKARAAASLAQASGNPDAISAPGVPDKIIDGLKTFIARNGLWSKSGYRGSGSYSRKTLELFQLISTKLAADCPVGFGTKEDIGRTERRGHSGGESMVKGMVGKHAYAILDVFSENVLARRKFIKAANPWGTYGRGYVDLDDSGAPRLDSKEIDGGVFWLELSDFASVANALYFGTPVKWEEPIQWTVNPLYRAG